MTSLLAVVLALALLSLRPADGDSRSPGEIRAALWHAGLVGFLLGSLRIALVAGLLVLNDVCRLIIPAVEGARIVLGALAYAVLSARRPAVGGTA